MASGWPLCLEIQHNPKVEVMRKCFCSVFFIGLLLMVTSASAQTVTVYNSIPKPLPGNVASEGPEAYAFAELGDGLGLLASGGGTFGQITVVMSSWPCETGNWTGLPLCTTTPGATFVQPITVKLYSVGQGLTGPVPVSLLGSITQTFNIPYRPSSTPSLCGGDAQRWYNSKDQTCYHGLAAAITVNFSNQHIMVPANNKAIVTVAYNTSHYGPSPIGNTACNLTSAGCPYDSLNISTDGSTNFTGAVSAPLDPNSIFVNYTLPNLACSPSTVVTGFLALDVGCWTGYHPQIQVQVNTNGKPNKKGSAP